MADLPALPTLHVVRAALHVAAVLGDRNAPVAVARESYWKRATGGVFSPADLQRGENALVAAGFLVRERGYLTRTPSLIELAETSDADGIELLVVGLLSSPTATPVAPAAEPNLDTLIPDPVRREALLLSLGRRFDDQLRREVGAIGEELVVASARAELSGLGHHDLASRVRRVSLVSDQLGYDIAAPRIAGSDRLLEVKATTGGSTDVFLSRNESDVGARLRDWALVVCEVHDVEARTGEVVGWCQASAIQPSLPTDAFGSRWQTVAIDRACLPLLPGLPRPAA